MLSNYFKRFLVSTIREIITNNSYKLLPEKSCKQFLQTITKEIIPNNSYKLLSQKSFQTMLSNYFKRFLVSIIREIITNNSYKLLTEKLFQKIPIHYDKHYKLCLKTIKGKLIFILQQQYHQTSDCKQYLQVLFREFNALQTVLIGLLVLLLQTIKLKNYVKKFCTNRA